MRFVAKHLAWIARFGRPHIRWLIQGIAAAVAVVAFRLFLPWPLKNLIDPWIVEQSVSTQSTLASEIDIQYILLWGTAFLAVAVGLGFADLVERLAFARFSIGTVRDLRAAAFEATFASTDTTGKKKTGDLIARLVGDTARIKAGLKGFLVHVATNSVQFLGMVCILLWIYPPIGYVFAAGGLLLLAITTLGAMQIYKRASRYRRKEGKIAQVIHRASRRKLQNKSFAKINHSSGKHEAAITKIQGRTTWAAHAIFGAIVLGSFWIGTLAAVSGDLDPANLIVLAMYGLMARTPIVQLARQGSRTGKILASVNRIVPLLETAASNDNSSTTSRALFDRIELHDIKVKAERKQGNNRRLYISQLEIVSGERIAVIGGSASGKTTLLELLAGLTQPQHGQIVWDDLELDQLAAEQLTSGPVHFVAQAPRWPNIKLCDFLGLPNQDTETIDNAKALLESCGLDELLQSLPYGLDSKLSSFKVSASERKALAVVRAINSDASLILLDEPTSSLGKSKAARLLRAVFSGQPHSTILVSFSRLKDVSLFDRVIELQSGEVVYDGHAEQWRSSDSPTREIADALEDKQSAKRLEGLQWSKP